MVKSVAEFSAEFAGADLLETCTSQEKAADLPKGFKQTEIGPLPQDWIVISLGEACDIKAAGDLDKESFSAFRDDKYPYPIFANAVSKAGLYGFTSRPHFPSGCVTVTARGELGHAFERTEPFAAIGRLLVLTPRAQLNAYILAAVINHTVEFSVESTGVPQLTAPQVAKYHIPLPPLREQEGIAEALSDADGAIRAVERLIEKKCAVKQAALHTLLTPTTRLPGFDGEWKAKSLGEVSRIKTGSRNNQDNDPHGSYSFFVRSQHVERIGSYSYDCEAVLVPGEGGIGHIFHYANGRFDVHQRVYAITNFEDFLDGKFLFYYMHRYFGAHAMEHSVKATVDSLRLPTFLKFDIALPPLDEQRAIATILSDMDAELYALEARRDKLKAVKQGMMQALLTGKVRLV